MNFFSLSRSGMDLVVALCILNFILITICLVSNVYYKKSKKRILTLCILLLISLVDTSSLMVLIYIPNMENSIELLKSELFIGNIPYEVHIAFVVGCIFYLLINLKKLYKENENALSWFSIKEAIEKLPTGIAFMSDRVELCLSNNIMHRLSKELTGKDLISGKVFWEAVLALQNSPKCIISGQAPAFVLGTGEVWQISKSNCVIDGDVGSYYQIKAENITDIYNIRQEAEKVNQKLSEQRQRLKEIEGMVAEKAEKQIAVDMKVSFHDNFGSLLTLTQKTMREDSSITQAKAITDRMSGLTDMITQIVSNDNAGISLEQIEFLAEKLDIELVMNAQIPEDEIYRPIILLCINEALKNTYRHANAKTLWVSISQGQDEIGLTLRNDDENTPTEIKEAGGLLSLRQKIEQVGGRMDITCVDGVAINIVFCKGELQCDEV